jgi:hypothetical protein
MSAASRRLSVVVGETSSGVAVGWDVGAEAGVDAGVGVAALVDVGTGTVPVLGGEGVGEEATKGPGVGLGGGRRDQNTLPTAHSIRQQQRRITSTTMAICTLRLIAKHP